MSRQRDINNARWSAADDLVGEYDAHPLRPVEEAILDRHRDALSGRVLEVGVGAGRLTARLVALGAAVTGIDLSPAMVEHTRARVPQADVRVGDLAVLDKFADATFDGLLAGYNVLDVLDHEERQAALAGWGRVVGPGGLLVVSSHNLAAADTIASPWRVLSRHPRTALANLRALPRRVANHRRLSALERRENGWAILNDEAHDHALLHYYVAPDEQQRQLAAAGFELLEVLDLDGQPDAASRSPELHYVARRSA